MKWRNKKVFPILITIFGMFSILMTVLLGCVIFLQYSRGAENALNMSRRLINENARQVMLKMDHLYEPMTFVAQQASTLPGMAEKPTLQNHPAEEFFLNTLDRYNQIQILYIGYEDGDFYEVLSLRGTIRDEIIQDVEAPRDSSYAILRQFTVENQDEPVRIWKYLNSTRQTVGSRKEEYTGYDPRNRPWYVNAIGQSEPVRTGPYLFSNIQQSGITVSRYLSSNLGGVLGVDMLLDEMSGYLDELGKEENALIMIFNSDGKVIAWPENAMLDETSDGLPEVASSTHPAIQVFLENFTWDMEELDIEELEIGSDSEDYIITIRRMPDTKDQFLFIAVSKNEVMAPIVVSISITAFISLGFLVLAIPIILFISRLISQPINKLVEEAKRIAEFHFEEDIIPESFIYETFRLGEEMAVMKRGLRHFARYVPLELVKQVLRSHDEISIGGERRELTLMFSDISDFTAISENSDPEVLFAQLSQYFQGMSSQIKKYFGTIDKYIGDSIMAFWNAPERRENHAELACNSALHMNVLSRNMNSQWQINNRPAFVTRIGIESGEAIVGNFGSSERFNYTVMGEMVNRCSRLEGLNKYYRSDIIIGEGTRSQLSNEYLVRPLDSVIVKGSNTPQMIFELVGHRDFYPVDEDFRNLISNTQEGMEQYIHGKLESALSLFRAALGVKPDEYNTQRMIRKCEAALKQPKDSWSPHQRMEVK